MHVIAQPYDGGRFFRSGYFIFQQACKPQVIAADAFQPGEVFLRSHIDQQQRPAFAGLAVLLHFYTVGNLLRHLVHIIHDFIMRGKPAAQFITKKLFG